MRDSVLVTKCDNSRCEDTKIPQRYRGDDTAKILRLEGIFGEDTLKILRLEGILARKNERIRRYREDTVDNIHFPFS